VAIGDLAAKEDGPGSGTPSAWRGERFAVERDQAGQLGQESRRRPRDRPRRAHHPRRGGRPRRPSRWPRDPAVEEIPAVEVEQLFVERLPRLRRLARVARHPRGVGDAGAVAQPMGSSVEAVVGRGRLDAVGQPPAEGGRARLRPQRPERARGVAHPVGCHRATSSSDQRKPRPSGAFRERRGRDSNPRWGSKPHTRLAGECLQPLGHLSRWRQCNPVLAGSTAATLAAARRGGRVVECTGLESRSPPRGPWVRIPPPPPSLARSSREDHRSTQHWRALRLRHRLP
jgi:hypothetical protein